MRPNILLLVLSLSLCILLACGGGGGNSSDGLTEDNQENEDTIENNDNNASSSQTSFIQLLDENYTLKQVWETKIGLPGQSVFLPTGDIVIADPNFNRISIISHNTVKVVAEEDNINGWGGVAALSDGRICYSLKNGQLKLINPDTGLKSNFSYIGDGKRVDALAADEFDNVYAATSSLEILKFGRDGIPFQIVDKLPFDFEGAIFDLDIDQYGIIYVAGFKRVISVEPDGTINIIADNLNNEPVYIDVAMDGSIYINETSYGLQKYNPIDKQLTSIRLQGFSTFAEVLSSDYDEIIFNEQTIFFKYNLTTNIAYPLLVIPGNSNAFAVNDNSTGFFATPGKPNVIDSYIISITDNGIKEEISSLEYGEIYDLDIDNNNLLCLSTNEGFMRIEKDNSITKINPIFESEKPPCCFLHWLATGPNNKWYVLSSNYDDLFKIYSFDDTGKVEFLPIVFDKSSFGGAYRLTYGNIDIDENGLVAIIVTAVGSLGDGPSYQRVYTANLDGTNLRQIAKLDSERNEGPVDIAIAPNGDLFVLSLQDNSEIIYKINHESQNITEFIRCDGGHDPRSINVDPNGKVWITTTMGIYFASPK